MLLWLQLSVVCSTVFIKRGFKIGVIQCEECTYIFSNKRNFCPKCGCPIQTKVYEENNTPLNSDIKTQASDNKILFKAITCVIITIIMVCILNSLPTGSWNNSNKDKAGITLANYNKIQTGMQYSQVADILGSRGKLVSSSIIMGADTENYSWHTIFGFKIIGVVFQNDKVVFKIQKGLE